MAPTPGSFRTSSLLRCSRVGPLRGGVGAATPRGLVRVARGFAIAAALPLLASCSDSPTEPEPAPFNATMTGEREKDFEGTAQYRLEDGYFVLRAHGEGPFAGQEMEFRALELGNVEPGTFTLGLLSEGGEPPDMVASWHMATALFEAIEGTLTIDSIADGEMRGEFSYVGRRTAVCNSLGSCQPLDGDQPENDVEGSFVATSSAGT